MSSPRISRIDGSVEPCREETGEERGGARVGAPPRPSHPLVLRPTSCWRAVTKGGWQGIRRWFEGNCCDHCPCQEGTKVGADRRPVQGRRRLLNSFGEATTGGGGGSGPATSGCGHDRSQRGGRLVESAPRRLCELLSSRDQVWQRSACSSEPRAYHCARRLGLQLLVGGLGHTGSTHYWDLHRVTGAGERRALVFWQLSPSARPSKLQTTIPTRRPCPAPAMEGPEWPIPGISFGASARPLCPGG